MVSVSVNRDPVAEWTAQHRMIADRVARRTLDGIGLQSTDTVEMGALCLFIRRQCTDQERRRVLEKFLSTP